jgi:hypothetical protein
LECTCDGIGEGAMFLWTAAEQYRVVITCSWASTICADKSYHNRKV